MKILIVVHGYPPTAVAGTEICAQRLCVALKAKGHEIFVIAREELPGYPEYKLIKGEHEGIPVLRIVNNFTRLQERYLYDYHPRIEEIFKDILLGFAPDLVHIQHLAGASWRIPALVKERGIPLAVSLHDYWYACERVQLLRPDGRICQGPQGGRSCARYCAHRSLSLSASAVFERARFAAGMFGTFPGERLLPRALPSLQQLVLPGRNRKLKQTYGARCDRLLGGLGIADVLISPSEKAREIYISLGVPGDKIVVIPHGAPPFPEVAGASKLNPYDGTRPLVIGYAGTIMPHKGVVTLLRALRKFPPERATLRMYGRPFPARFARYMEKLIRRFPEGQVEMQGTYRPGELPGILAGVDLLVIPSLWHETFNLVLWEAWAARLPVIASHVGALSDFIREGVDGLTFSPGDWRDLHERIARILDNPELLQELRAQLPRSCMSIEENAARYEEVYSRLLS
ncbi:MAG: glycosyltransferase [Candidatus Aureabacteria bacterium]|nr:glycosyltransferase [Candidatus Auribacterota bacterium]